MNALIETDRIEIKSGAPEVVDTPSESGNGQKIYRCPKCHVALWSVYSGAGPKFSFVRVGALENPDACPPDIHIFTESKQPWLTLPDNVPVVDRYYDREKYWPQASLERRLAAIELD